MRARNSLSPVILATTSLVMVATGFALSVGEQPLREWSFGLIDGPSNRELIDRLTSVDSMSVGYSPEFGDSLAFFIGADAPSDVDPEVIGVDPETFSVQSIDPPPALVTLISRGATAVPALLSHLDDPRPTQVQFCGDCDLCQQPGSQSDRSTWCVDSLDDDWWYEPRIRVYEHLFLRRRNRTVREIKLHRLTVGDLCFVAIGQIVHRDFNVFLQGGSNCGTINSPSADPRLAAAIRADWSGLTIAEHRRSLIADAFLLDQFDLFDPERSPAYAVRRLCHYYPRTAEHVLDKLFSRKLYGNSEAFSFAVDHLKAVSDDVVWKPKFERFRRLKGETAAIGALLELRRIRREIEGDVAVAKSGIEVRGGEPRMPEVELQHVNAVLNKLLPTVGGESALETVASYHQQTVMLKVIVGCAPKSLTQRLPNLMNQVKVGDHWEEERFLEACVKVLEHAGQHVSKNSTQPSH